MPTRQKSTENGDFMRIFGIVMKENEKFTESHVIYSRVLWDDAIDKQPFWIGFIDRMSASGVRERHLLDWNPDGDIPWHRVIYFRCGDVRVWDRQARVDLFKQNALPAAAWIQRDNPFLPTIIRRGDAAFVFENRPCFAWDGKSWQASEARPLSVPCERLRCLTWNILKDYHNPAIVQTAVRLPVIMEFLKNSDADIIALQEVTRAVWQKFLQQDWARRYYISDLSDSAVFSADSVVILSKYPFIVSEHIFSTHKRLLIARLELNDRAVQVATLHLTSDMSANAPEKRAQQIAVLFDWLDAKESDAIILGDFNADTAEQARFFAGKGFDDAWRALHAGEGYTFYPQENRLASLLSPSQRARRIDALYLKSRAWQPSEASVEATQPIAGKEDLYASDHFALAVTLQYGNASKHSAFAGEKPSYQQGIVWIPPAAAWRNIQDIRARFDAKFARWMPHITLIYGFIPEERFAEAVPLIAEALQDFAPFALTLEGWHFFEHTQTYTAVLVPDQQARAQLQALQARLQGLFPTCDEQSTKEKGFNPHLSVGQFLDLEEGRRALPAWKPLQTEVSQIALISRDKDAPFEVRYTVAVGKGTFAQVLPAWRQSIEQYMPLCTREGQARRLAVLDIVREACKEAIAETVQVELMGSERLGIVSAQSDIDLACLIPLEVERNTFLHRLQRVLEGFATSMRLAEDAQIPVLKVQIEGVWVDILVAQVPFLPVVLGSPALLRAQSQFDALSWQIIAGVLEADTILQAVGEVLEMEKFRLWVRAVRAWARARGIVGNAWGYLGSFSWTTLSAVAALAYCGQENAPTLAGFLAFFFRFYAQWDWRNPVAVSRMGNAYKVSARRDKLPIITSVEPCFNSAKNVVRSTQRRIKAEFARAHALTRKTVNDEALAQVFEALGAIGRAASHKIVLEIQTNDANTLAQCLGWLEGNAIGLLIALETLENLAYDYLPALPTDEKQAIWEIFVIGEGAQEADILPIVRDFVGKMQEGAHLYPSFGAQARFIAVS